MTEIRSQEGCIRRGALRTTERQTNSDSGRLLESAPPSETFAEEAGHVAIQATLDRNDHTVSAK